MLWRAQNAETLVGRVDEGEARRGAAWHTCQGHKGQGLAGHTLQEVERARRGAAEVVRRHICEATVRHIAVDVDERCGNVTIVEFGLVEHTDLFER